MLDASIGRAAAWMLAQFLRTLLYGVTPADPVTYVVAVVLLLVVASAASGVPAWRAAVADPTQTLRTE